MTNLKYANPRGIRQTIVWMSTFIAMGIIASVVLFYLPMTRASFVVDVKSKMVGESQLFYGNGPAYEQKKSVWQHISVGDSRLQFPLRGSYTSARWDPLDGAGSLQINNPHVSVLGFQLKLGSISLNPLHQISKMQADGGWVNMSTIANATDPQLDLVLNFAKVEQQRMLISALVGFLAALIVTSAIRFRRNVVALAGLADGLLMSNVARLRRDGLSLRELASLFAIGLIFYLYFLSNFSFSIDDEMAAVRHDPGAWVSQGRWFVYLVEKFVFPQSAIPFAPYLLLVGSLAISYALILRAHALQPSWQTYLVYPVFVAFPTWWFISEFYSNIPALAFGIVFVSYGAYLTFRDFSASTLTTSSSLAKNVLIVLLLACAMGAYQSLLLLYISVIFGALLFRSYCSDMTARELTSRAFASLIKNMLLVVASVITYGVINKITQVFVATDSGYISNFVNFKALTDRPLEVLSLVAAEMSNLYSGDAIRYGASIGLSSLIMIVATAKLLSRDIPKSIVRLILWIGLLATPFALNFVSGGLPLPMRSMLAIAYVAWVASLFVIYTKRPVLITASVVLIGLYQIQIFSLNSQYMVSATITQSHDRMLAADIYKRIGEVNKDFDRTAPLEVDVYGRKAVSTVFANGWSSTMQGSFFSWDDGNLDRMSIYMKIMGYENISTPNMSKRISLTPLFEKMPIWPAAGSVTYVDGRYLVRLSKEPDPIHARFVRLEN